MGSVLEPLYEHEEKDEPQVAAQEEILPKSVRSSLEMKLVSKRIALKFCEFKISNHHNKMFASETVAISNLGIHFLSPLPYKPGILMRVWIEMPDYWARKSRIVSYRHTSAPTYFQILTRVVNCEESGNARKDKKFAVMCENVNLDPTDEVVLNEYLGVRHS